MIAGSRSVIAQLGKALFALLIVNKLNSVVVLVRSSKPSPHKKTFPKTPFCNNKGLAEKVKQGSERLCDNQHCFAIHLTRGGGGGGPSSVEIDTNEATTTTTTTAAAACTDVVSSSDSCFKDSSTEESSPFFESDDVGRDDGEEMTFVITNEQRRSLLSSSLSSSSPPEELLDQDTWPPDLLEQIRQTFEREGVVVIRGLLSDHDDDDDDKEGELSKLTNAGKTFVETGSSVSRMFDKLKFGHLLCSPPPPKLSAGDKDEDDDAPPLLGNDDEKMNDPEIFQAFRHAALYSAIPGFIARILLRFDENKRVVGAGSADDGPTLRVLKDAFLCKKNETSFCGWHVDDSVFWPIVAQSSPPGINAWIALDDINSEHGGGIAVSPRSHVASWRKEAYRTIGSTQNYPNNGSVSPEPGTEEFKKSFGQTCSMEELNPNLASKIESSAKIFDFRRGDVLFHTRWIFHRSLPLTTVGREYYERTGKTPTFKRYSIRYEVGSAQLLHGFNGEPCVLLNPENAGKTLDQVVMNSSSSSSSSSFSRNGSAPPAVEPWYPKCWPVVEELEMNELNYLVRKKLPVAEKIRRERMKKLLPLLRKTE